MIRKLILPLLLAGMLPSLPSLAQTAPQLKGKENLSDTLENGDDLMALLQDPAETASPQKDYTTATFKATRLINGHSIENVGKGVLDFRISHRFNTLNNGISDFFGLDGATTKLGFDYGVTNWLMIGIGRSTLDKEYDGFVKAKILRQTNDGKMPLSVSFLGSMMAKSAKYTVPEGTEYYFSNRLSYASQILVARKFSEILSLQIMPTFVHYNLVQYRDDPNNVFAIGIGGRIKLTRRISLNGEYYYRLPDSKLRDTRNSLSVGFDIETGGHVFQLHFTNSTGMSERSYIGQTVGDWANGDIRFGFNISRVFTIVRPKEFKNSRNKIY